MARMGAQHVRLAKAELHLHLEGSIEPETIRELDPARTIEEIRDHYRYDNFLGFLKSYVWVIEHLRTPADYALITRRLLDRLERQNVLYAEINLSAGVILWKKQDLAAIYEAVRKEAAAADLKVRWIFDAVRQWGAEHAMRVAELAVERRGDGVVGFGIGGDETRGPAALFGAAFKLARRNGLHLTPHAGETEGPESIWESLRVGAERIGHGIRAAEDPELMRHLRDHDIPLEICVSSNVCTGAVESLRSHPLRKLYDAGVPLVLNTDDPAMFQTTLAHEYEIAEREFGFMPSDLELLAANSFRYAFAWDNGLPL